MSGMREIQSKSAEDCVGDVNMPVDAESTATSSDSMRESDSIPPLSSASPTPTLASSSPNSSLLVQTESVSTSIISSINTPSSAQETTIHGDNQEDTAADEKKQSNPIFEALKQTETEIPEHSNLKLVQPTSAPDPPGTHNDHRTAGPVMADVELVDDVNRRFKEENAELRARIRLLQSQGPTVRAVAVDDEDTRDMVQQESNVNDETLTKVEESNNSGVQKRRWRWWLLVFLLMLVGSSGVVATVVILRSKEPSISPLTMGPTELASLSPTDSFSPSLAPMGFIITSESPTSGLVAPVETETSLPTTTSLNPTKVATESPTHGPSRKPTIFPTHVPSPGPSPKPTMNPTKSPTRPPSLRPTTARPTESPTTAPSHLPSAEPTVSFSPTQAPTPSPTKLPTSQPTFAPTFKRRDFWLRLLLPTLDSSTFATEDEWNEHLLANPNTPQAQAMEWLSEVDEWELVDAEWKQQENIERYAVVVFYYSTSGPHWNTTSNYLDPTSRVCRWNTDATTAGSLSEGFYCDTGSFGIYITGWVSAVRFSSDYVTGSLPSEIALLGSLTDLYLYHTALTGVLPSTLPSSLENLNLYANRMSGTIPSEWAVSMPNLMELGLVGNDDVSGTIPSELGLLTKLEKLSLDSSSLIGSIPTTLGKAVALERLDLGSTSLTGTIPTELGELSALGLFHISGTSLTGTLPSELGNLSEIWDFDASRTALHGTIPLEYGNWSNLSSVHIAFSDFTGSLDMFCALATDDHSIYITADCDMDCSCCTNCWS